jgi:hypothetical protein
MATPKPQSYDQIYGDMIRAYIAKKGINDVNAGSVISSFYESVALSIARASGDVFQTLRDLSVDRAVGDALRNIAKDEGLQELPARVASGTVTVTDTSFTKISTKIYAGGNPPNIGSTTLLVSDASAFTPTGSLYIGRGTPNVEGPLAYSSVTPIGGYWQITLSSPTTKFHNINESVVLAQGGVRNISSGITVKAPASGASPDINFTVTQSAVILDGETEVQGVPVSAQEPGTVGNVPIGGIREFAGAPFSGAAVANPLPFRTGRDVETDDELRIRIKRARLSKGLGTSLAVKNAVIGATPSDENATVVSSEIVQTSDNVTTLYVDDGTGYEAKTAGIGIETLVDSAIGGENYFQLKTGGKQTSVVKAFLVSNLKAPFAVSGEDRLAISIGGTVTEHIFQNSDFLSPGGATAYELVASINANTALNFSASTSEGGTKVVLFAKVEENEAISAVEVTLGNNVAELIGLPSNTVETLRLFKNKKPLSKDGNTATVSTERQADWSASIADGDTLVLSVDSTSPITYTIQNADFIAEGTYTSVAASNSLESWVNVFNSKLTGVTAAIVGERITLTSNLDQSNRAKVQIDPSSTLVSKGMFSVSQGLLSLGKAADYKLSRNTAQVRLNTPLSAGDSLAAGTADTEARIESARILGGNLTLVANAYLWLVTDDKNASLVLTGVVSNTQLSVAKPSANIVRYVSTVPNAFDNAQVGDYVIVWSEELSSSNRLEGRVNASSSTTLDLLVTPAEYAAAVVEGPVIFQEGLVIVRTEKVPQKFKVLSGTKTLSEIVDELNSQSTTCEFDVFDDEVIIVKTLTKTEDGAVFIVTLDDAAKPLSLPTGTVSTSNESLFAFYESGFKEGEFPLFVHALFAAGAAASPPDSYISSILTSVSLPSTGLDPNFIVGYLQPYGAAADALSTSETTPLDSYSGSTITLEQDKLVKRLRANDRWYAANPLDFGAEDDMVVVLDDDASNKTFPIRMYRNIKTNTTLAANPTSFNAYDLDAGPTSAMTTYFPSTFKFDNYKVLMRAKNVLDHSATQDAILFRAVQWGRSGERVNVAYTYPTAPNSPILSTITVDENVNIKISLKSGAAVPTTIDGTTEWDVAITPNTPVAGVDQVTYSWTGTGSTPGLGGLAGGEYVTILPGSQLSKENTGTFRVSTEIGFAPTATSFTVVRANGEAVAENDKATLIANVFSFYANNPTTALEIQTFVSADTALANFVTATIVNDSGLAGTGVISLSTAEESDFSIDSVSLLDGINWVQTTALSSSPQFVFKKPLDLPTATGYAFNDGEEIRFLPTSIEQLAQYLNILAVTGYTTLGKIQLSQNAGRLELSSNVLGGNGSVQIVGGQANLTSTPILGSSLVINNSSMLAGISKAGLDGLHSDQWVKLTALNKQKKETLFKQSMSVRIESNTPSIGQSTVSLINRTLTDRHLGKPRHHVRTLNRTFKVEKQGSLACVSWNGNGTQPFLSKQVNLNDVIPGTLNVERIVGTSETAYLILPGSTTSFTEVSIGDLLTVNNLLPANSGTFLVTGVSSDGKTIRVLNPSGVNQFSSGTFTITDNTDVAGDDFIVDGNLLQAGVDFSVGATAADTAANLASAISALPNVSATSLSNVVTVVADIAMASINISYVNNIGLAGAVESGPSLEGVSYSAGDFSCTTEVAENDTVIIDAPFDILNRGTFRVVRRYENSFYIENESAVEEEVTDVLNSINLGFDGTTQFDVDPSGGILDIFWNSTGTEPTLGNAKVGDIVTLGTDFSADNQGSFMVTKAEPKLQQLTKATFPAGALLSGGQHFLINSAEDATLYYVWVQVDGIGIDPAVIGRTGILVNVASTDSSSQVAAAFAATINASLDFDAVATANTVKITNAGFGPCAAVTNVNMASTTFETIVSGQRTKIHAINPAVTAEGGVVITDVFECHRPAIRFFEYEASVTDDVLYITSPFLGSSNQGAWKILQIIDQDKMIVEGTMAPLDPTGVLMNDQAIFIEEREPFSGYKKVSFVSVDPANVLLRALVMFDTRYQSSKINEAAGVQIEAVGKLGFSTTVKKGLDSYRYHTGLIGECNRIVYGEPRDSTTYPGVAAAGAEIFIREPLIRRVQVGVAVRVETGIPFAQIVEQVRTNVSALINGNPIATPIAISDIVSSVNAIPGVRAMAITSPLYNSSNDTINIGPSEKAKIIDVVNDVSVTQIS